MRCSTPFGDSCHHISQRWTIDISSRDIIFTLGHPQAEVITAHDSHLWSRVSSEPLSFSCIAVVFHQWEHLNWCCLPGCFPLRGKRTSRCPIPWWFVTRLRLWLFPGFVHAGSFSRPVLRWWCRVMSAFVSTVSTQMQTKMSEVSIYYVEVVPLLVTFAHSVERLDSWLSVGFVTSVCFSFRAI